MKTFTVRNTNEAMYVVYPWLVDNGVQQETRNGPAIVAPCNVSIKYTHPEECVNVCPIRDANPFFHMAESLWMISGSQYIEPLLRILPSFSDYSDDGYTHNSAYGYRARRHFGLDQLLGAANELLNNRNTRQAIVQLWDAADLGRVTKDKACNMQLVFMKDVESGKLNMTIYNRSNDAIWGGVAGANVVHMNYIHQFVTAAAGMQQGGLEVVSTNLHIYTQNPKFEALMNVARKYRPFVVDAYQINNFNVIPLSEPSDDMTHITDGCESTLRFFSLGYIFSDPAFKHSVRFIKSVALPILRTWELYREGCVESAITEAAKIESTDWRFACTEWIKRRVK